MNNKEVNSENMWEKPQLIVEDIENTLTPPKFTTSTELDGGSIGTSN